MARIYVLTTGVEWGEEEGPIAAYLTEGAAKRAEHKARVAFRKLFPTRSEDHYWFVKITAVELNAKDPLNAQYTDL